ncbi:uncharacterized protein LOC144628079 [Oculina patagonica]
MLRSYGSAAEDLKCHEPYDLGDMDIMIFPNSDNLMIYEELFEYSLENPLHVRIKGSDHPVLQSCVVEDTEYVAISALKNFHPAVFGCEAPDMVDIATRTFQTLFRKEFSPIAEGSLKNIASSPAVTLDFVKSLENASEKWETLKDTTLNIPVLGAGEMEWIASIMCRFKGIDYTRHHAEVLRDIMCDTNPMTCLQKLSAFPEDTSSGEETAEKKHRCIESRSLHETKENEEDDREEDSGNCSLVCLPFNGGECGIDRQQNNNDQQRSPEDLQSTSKQSAMVSTSPENSLRLSLNENKGATSDSVKDHKKTDENKLKKGRLPFAQNKELNSKDLPSTSDCKEIDEEEEFKRRRRRDRWVKYLLGKEAKTNGDQTQETESSHEFLKQPMSKEGTASQGLEGKNETKKNGDCNSDQNESNVERQAIVQKVEETSKDVTHNLKTKEYDENRELNRRIQNRYLEHMFGTGSETKKALTQKAKLKDTERVKSGIDFVPAFRSPRWPKVAREWIKRERKWPAPDVIDKVIQEGFHLVVKPPKNNGNPECDFRISFSHAEYLLSQEMNDIQRECYRCLKRYYRAYLSTQPKSLVSFHLKNIFLQTIEETSAESWTESNRAHCMMKILENLLDALRKKDVRHFFVRSYNLFGEDYIEKPEILESLADKVQDIMESPIQFTKQLILKQEDAKDCKKKEIPAKENFPNDEPTSFAKPVTHEEQKKTDEVSSEGSDDTQYKKDKATVPLIPKKTTQGNDSPEYRYHDLKDAYLEVTKELLHMAFNNADFRLETIDPFERSLVEDLRELVRNEGFPVEELPGMFESSWRTIGYLRVWLSTEPDTRRRLLVAVQSSIEILKYVLKQDDITPGNDAAVEAVYNRMLDPSSENPFDFSNIVPSGIVTQYAQSAFSNIFVTSPPQPNMHDDIPLD